MQWARSLRGEVVIKFQLVTGDLIYGYQWAVAGSVYMAIAGGILPTALLSAWAGIGVWLPDLSTTEPV